MAKTSKKEVEKVETVQEEIQEEVKTEEVKQEEQSNDADEAYKKRMEERQKMKKFVTLTSTPYLASSNKFNNVSGFIPPYTVCYIEEEIDDPQKGSFYKVGFEQYVNKQWEVKML